MAALESYINEPNKDDLEIILKDTENDPNHVLGLVEQLQASLTSIDKDTRANATRLLVEVLDRIEALPSTDLEPLTDFFCDRIKDHHSIVPHVIAAFQSLSRNSTLPDACAVSITRAIFQHAEVQTLIQQHRACAFQVIGNLFNTKLDVLAMMNEAFPLGYIQMIDGEKDPRNLLSIFRLTQVVINNFPIGICCEDLFEVSACYFPVDFTPPPGDAFQISRQQLVDELRAVMSATPKFSKYCIPLLIEKISSDLQSAKQDSFQTLVDCCKVYTVDELRPFVNTLTQLILREAMLSPSTKTEELALKATAALSSCLATPAEGVTVYTDVDEYYKSLLKDCRHHLFEPDHKLVAPSVKIIQALVSSNHHVANAVLADVLPTILERVNTSQESKKKRIYLNMIKEIMSCCRSDVSTQKQSALPSLIEHLEHEVADVSIAAMQCLAVFSTSMADKMEAVSATLLDMATNAPSESKRKEASMCLSAFCRDNSEENVECILLPICKQLAATTTLDLHVLHMFDVIMQECRDDIRTRLLLPLLACCQRCVRDRDDLLEAILNTLHYAVTSLPDELESYYLSEFMNTCLDEENTVEIHEDQRQHINYITMQLVNATIHSSLKPIAASVLKRLKFTPFALAAIQSFLCTIPCEVVDSKDVLSLFIPASVSPKNSADARLSACKICCSIMNKSAGIDKLLDGVLNLFNMELPSNLQICTWITKSLLVRNHRLSQELLTHIIKWLKNPKMSAGAAEGFGTILQEYPDVLNPKQQPIIRLMYKQRVFVSAFPVIHDMFTSIEPELLANVHIAVTNLIRYVPRQVISNDKQMLLTVLVKLLASEDEQVLLRTLQVMSDDSDTKLLGQHIDTLLPLLLKLSRYPANMQVRISSLQCLNSLSKIGTPLIVPHMNTVIKGLLPAIDDKKRIVRQEAVKARNIWCMLRDGV